MTLLTGSKHPLNERWAATHLWGIEISQFLLWRLEPGEEGRHWKDGLTPDVIEFIVQKCKCAYCDSVIVAPMVPCACGRVSEDWDWVELAAAFPREELTAQVNRLYARQKSRIGSMRRNRALKIAGGRITFEEKKSLLKVQEGLCYYCGKSLIDKNKSVRYHCDHFVSLMNGGRSDLENTVLACVRCNLLKNSDDGRYFIHRVRRLQLIENPLGLAKMRKALGFWRKSQGLRALSTLIGN